MSTPLEGPPLIKELGGKFILLSSKTGAKEHAILSPEGLRVVIDTDMSIIEQDDIRFECEGKQPDDTVEIGNTEMSVSEWLQVADTIKSGTWN